VDWRRPLWSSVILFRSRWYTLGVLIAMAGWGLHVGALSLAPISLGALSDHLGSDSAAAILFSPLAAVILLASLIALLVSARSLQIAPPRGLGDRRYQRGCERAHDRRRPDRLLRALPG
jgi:hypothetical protein